MDENHQDLQSLHDAMPPPPKTAGKPVTSKPDDKNPSSTQSKPDDHNGTTGQCGSKPPEKKADGKADEAKPAKGWESWSNKKKAFVVAGAAAGAWVVYDALNGDAPVSVKTE